mgnify:CR=1 FL=1
MGHVCSYFSNTVLINSFCITRKKSFVVNPKSVESSTPDAEQFLVSCELFGKYITLIAKDGIIIFGLQSHHDNISFNGIIASAFHLRFNVPDIFDRYPLISRRFLINVFKAESELDFFYRQIV